MIENHKNKLLDKVGLLLAGLGALFIIYDHGFATGMGVFLIYEGYWISK